ncbi:MAG: T9SS type A sorting domain-containing protein [Bacteroidetes bacterium]|nr:T9SS type A sorting domain-containing protein [Bacteroidota bacterium]
MKYLYLIMVSILLSLQISAQPTPSSCSAPDSVVQKYIIDAKGLAVQAMQKSGSPFYDSVIIPQEWTDTVLHALLAVYNTTSGARDSVVGYHIHCTDFKDLNKFYIYADTGLAWVRDIKNGIIPTSNTAVNNIISTYKLVKLSYSPGVILFKSDSIYNLHGMSEAWNRIDSITLYPDLLFYTSTIFVDTMTMDYIQLRFRYSCGVDCPSGCEVNRYWKYKVYNNCSVEYLGSYGSPIKSVGCINLALEVKDVNRWDVKVYPNPFFDKLKVDGIDKETSYTVTNILGQECLSGTLKNNADISTSILKPGIYFIKLQSGNIVQEMKIIKAE